MKSNFRFNLLLGIVMTALVGCTTNLTGENFGRQETRVMNDVFFGQIVKIRHVTIDGANSGQGAAAGAVAGALEGTTMGGTGSNQAFSTLGGGLIGAVFGQGAEERLTRKAGVDMLIALDGGRNVAIVQEEGKDKFAVGQRVRVMTANGISRVVPDNE